MDKIEIAVAAGTLLELHIRPEQKLRAVLRELPRSARELEESYIEAYGADWRQHPDNHSATEDVQLLRLYREAEHIAGALEQLEKGKELSKRQHDAMHHALPLLSYQADMEQQLADSGHIVGEIFAVAEDMQNAAKRPGEFIPPEEEQEKIAGMQKAHQINSETYASMAAAYRNALTQMRAISKALHKPSREADPEGVMHWANKVLDTQLSIKKTGHGGVVRQSFEHILKQEFPRRAAEIGRDTSDHAREAEILARGPRYAAILERLADGYETTPVMIEGVKQLQKYIRQRVNEAEQHKAGQAIDGLDNVNAMMLQLIRDMGSVNRGRAR